MCDDYTSIILKNDERNIEINYAIGNYMWMAFYFLTSIISIN